MSNRKKLKELPTHVVSRMCMLLRDHYVDAITPRHEQVSIDMIDNVLFEKILQRAKPPQKYRKSMRNSPMLSSPRVDPPKKRQTTVRQKEARYSSFRQQNTCPHPDLSHSGAAAAAAPSGDHERDAEDLLRDILSDTVSRQEPSREEVQPSPHKNTLPFKSPNFVPMCIDRPGCASREYLCGAAIQYAHFYREQVPVFKEKDALMELLDKHTTEEQEKASEFVHTTLLCKTKIDPNPGWPLLSRLLHMVTYLEFKKKPGSVRRERDKLSRSVEKKYSLPKRDFYVNSENLEEFGEATTLTTNEHLKSASSGFPFTKVLYSRSSRPPEPYGDPEMIHVGSIRYNAKGSPEFIHISEKSSHK